MLHFWSWTWSAVDADDQSEVPPGCVIDIGVAAVAEGSRDAFEGIGSQGLGLHPPVPWRETIYDYAAGGGSRSRASAFPARRRPAAPRRRRRSALRFFWRSSASFRR